MTPVRSGGKGTFLLERTFPGVGLVKRASGTLSVRQWEAMNQMLSTFWSHGRLDVLEAIRAKHLHPMKAFSTFQNHGLEGFPRGADFSDLAALQAWADKRVGKSANHTQNVQSLIRVFLRSAQPDERLKDLQGILRRYRHTAAHVIFNRLRAALLAYAHETAGQSSPLWLAVRDVPPNKYAPPGGNPFTPVQLASFGLTQPFLGMAWTMCLTGMGQADYWGKWEAQIDRVRIPGAKGRPRIVPRVGTLVLPGATYKDMLEAFEVTGHRLYDCRNSYAAWCEDANVAPSRIALYMGHKAKNQTQHYQRRKVEPYLRADAKLLSAYVGKAQQAVRQA